MADHDTQGLLIAGLIILGLISIAVYAIYQDGVTSGGQYDWNMNAPKPKAEPKVKSVGNFEPRTPKPKNTSKYNPAEEDFPIAQYETLLDKTDRFNPHKGGNFFMEEQNNDLLSKQGVMSTEDCSRHSAYVDGQFGRWGLATIAADDRRSTTSPYHGATRSARAVKIRDTDSIKPDKVSDTYRLTV